jgi:hypothetical protein
MKQGQNRRWIVHATAPLRDCPPKIDLDHGLIGLMLGYRLSFLACVASRWRLIYFGDVHVGTIMRCSGNPNAAPQMWRRSFDDPIPLPRGRQLVTLEAAGNYITKLPKAEHETPEWQAAMQGLLLVATSGGLTMLARIDVMRAINRHVDRVFISDRKPHHWGKRKLARDR